MLTPITNIHHHELPAPGDIGRITGLSTVNPRRRCIVESYRVTDSPQYRGRFFSYGIHTFIARFLDNGERQRFSGIWFKSEAE